MLRLEQPTVRVAIVDAVSVVRLVSLVSVVEGVGEAEG